MNINWAGFLAVVLLAYIIPGPDFVVIVRAATASRRAGLAAALGAQSGLCVHMLAATTGLSLLLTRLPGALVAIQVAGAAYLLYLGVRVLLATRRSSVGVGHQEHPGATEQPAAGRWWLQGFTTNLLNPKAVLFFVSVLPQFIDSRASLPQQVLLLGIIDIAIGVALWAALAVGASRLSNVLAAPTARRRFDRTTGALFIGLGVLLAVAHA